MKTVTVEELLSWAFVHELTKGGGVEGLVNANSAWRMISELGTRVSTGQTGAGGGENYFIEQGEPNEDAVTAGRAVAALADCEAILPLDWNPLSDWPPETIGLAQEAIERAVQRFTLRKLRAAGKVGESIVGMVIGAAILGRAPDWSAEPSKVRIVERGGKPAWFIMRKVNDSLGRPQDIEVDGYNARSGRPFKGAYRRYEFSTDPAGDILGRLDWQLWVAALRLAERRLQGQLIAHQLRPCSRSMTPWLPEDRGGISLLEKAAEAPRKKTASAR
jgi:hypothetical protein